MLIWQSLFFLSTITVLVKCQRITRDNGGVENWCTKLQANFNFKVLEADNKLRPDSTF